MARWAVIRSASSLLAASPPIASPRAANPAVSDGGISLSVKARTKAMTMQRMRCQKAGASSRWRCPEAHHHGQHQ